MQSKWIIDYFSSPHNFKGDDALQLIMPDVTGGTMSLETLDEIRQHPAATKIVLSGLRQNTFDYFVENYARQFEVIHFWKCPLVEDLSMLSGLEKVKYVLFFFNQRATRLWDMTNNEAMVGLSLDDFSRMHTLDDIPSAPSLEEFHVGNKVWTKQILESLKPLSFCKTVKNLSFSAKTIVDNDITPIANMASLEELIFFDKLFTTEQIAWLTAKMPHVKSMVLAPYWQHEPIRWETSSGIKMKDTRVCGKGKPFLDSQLDKKRLEKHVAEFFALVEKYSHEN